MLLLVLLSWLIKAGTARRARLRGRGTGGAAVNPAEGAGQLGSNKHEMVGLPALVGSPTGAVSMVDSPTRGDPSAEAASPPASPPQPEEALPTAMDTAPPRGATDPACRVEDGVGWRVVRGFAAAHNRHETLDALMAYARKKAPQADDLDGPERLVGTTSASGRKLPRLVGRGGLAEQAEKTVEEVLAEQAEKMVEEVLSDVGREGMQVGMKGSDGSTIGLSLIATFPEAPDQPWHKDANRRNVLSVIVALNRRQFRVFDQEPIWLAPGDALVFEASKLCHGGAGLGPGADMAVALFAYAGNVSKSVVTKSFACSAAQRAQALTNEEMIEVLEEFADDEEQTREDFAEHGELDMEVIAELHSRLLTSEGELRLVLRARDASIILRSLRRAVTLASPEQTLFDLKEGRWPGEASVLLRCARLAVAIAPTLDLPTGEEELVRDVIFGLAPVLRHMLAGVVANPVSSERPAPSLGLRMRDTIADLLEWGRRALPELASADDGILAPLVEHRLWKASHGPTDGTCADTFAQLRALMADLGGACDREAAPKIPAPASEATVTLSLAYEVTATSRDAFAAAFRRDVAASLDVNENAVFVLAISADSAVVVVDFSVPGAGDVAGILRGDGLSTTYLTHFNGGVSVDAEVGDKTCPLLWQAADSMETRSWERRLTQAFHPEGMMREEEGRDVLAKFLLLSSRLVAIGWVQIKLAAAAADDEETAGRLGRAYGDIFGRARAEAEKRGRAEDHGRWTDATLEVASGGLHMFFYRAQAFADRPDGVGSAFWREFVGAARVGGEWAPLQLLSETQTSAGARLGAMPWLMWNRRPVAGATSGDTPARPVEEPEAEALSAQAETDLVNRRAAEARRAAASRWRARQRETDIWRWQAIWREMGTARARVQQIARIVARGQWRGRYPEVLIVENATQLMDLLHNQLEAQPPGDRCWGGRNTPVDEVPIVALASDVAAWVEELFRTGYVGTVDRGPRCVRQDTAEPPRLPPQRIDAPLLRMRERPPPELLPGGALPSDGAASRRVGVWPACCARMLDTAADFGEPDGGRLTEQAVRELLVAARAALWEDRQACTLALILSTAPMTAKAAAVLDEAVPGLARHLTRQGIGGKLSGREHAVACIVRHLVAETDHDATGGTASRRWDRWNDELEPRYPVVEALARALEGALSRGATFVVRYGMVDCSGLHPSVFFRPLHWQVHAYSRCSNREMAQLHPRSGWRQAQWFARYSRRSSEAKTPPQSAPSVAHLPLGDALDANASMAQRGEAQRFGQQVARMLLAKGGRMPITDLIDAHRAAFGLHRHVSVKVDFKAKSLLALLAALPGLTLPQAPRGDVQMVEVAAVGGVPDSVKHGRSADRPGESGGAQKCSRRSRPRKGKGAGLRTASGSPPSLSPPLSTPRAGPSAVCASSVGVTEQSSNYSGEHGGGGSTGRRRALGGLLLPAGDGR